MGANNAGNPHCSHPKATQPLGLLADGLQHLGAKVASRVFGAERTRRTFGAVEHHGGLPTRSFRS